MSPISVADLDLGQTLKRHEQGLLVLPLLENLVEALGTPKVVIRFRPHPLDKAPGDGWFHPSTHPLWSARALYEYLVNPEKLVPDKPSFEIVMSRDIGSATHEYVQAGMRQMGLLPKDLQACTTCPPERKCTEPGVQDETVGVRGHMDGVCALPGRPRGGDVLELKTNGDQGARKMLTIEDLDLDGFKEKFPDYYAQAQCYQKMSGRRNTVLVMLNLGMPWHRREFHIPFDRPYVNRIWEKFADVRQAVANQQPPRCDCPLARRTKCRARRLCGGLRAAN